MEKSNLLGLLESDREMILAGINRDRAPEAVQATLEKAVDRLMLRHAEACGDAQARDEAQLLLTAIRSSLPLVDSVGEVRRWQKTVNGAPNRRKFTPLSLAALAAGTVLILAALLGLMFTGGRLTGVVALIEALVPAVLGIAAVFWSGMRCAAPKKARAGSPAADVRDEFLVDTDKLWHHLRGIALLADSALDNARSRTAARQQREAAAAADAALPRDQAELFAGLLENAYAQGGADAREMVESMRFFLHGAGVEVVDYEKGRESWFEFLPAQTPGTIRPALVAGDRLIKKGMASA